jgi:hypothetical protein
MIQRGNMTTSTHTETTPSPITVIGEIVTPKLAPTPPPRAVTIECAKPENGRLPVTVMVVPVTDADIKGGVFVDFRAGAQASDSDHGHVSRFDRGDEAVAALAAKEAKDAADARDGDAGEAAAPAPDKRSDASGKHPIISLQIGKAMKLTVGQAESFRAEVAMPAPHADDSQVWYVRGRFATLGGKDLSSAWHKV